MLRDVSDLDLETFSLAGSGERAASHAVDVHAGASGATATIPDAHLLFNSDFIRAGHDLILRGHDGGSAFVRDYFASDERPALLSRDGARLSGDLVEAMSGSPAPNQYAQAGTPAPAPAASDAVGRVVTSSGDASIIRNGVAVTLKAGDPVLRADVLQTVGGTMAVTFNDGSTLNLTPNTRIVVSEFVYSPNGAGNSQLLNLVQGSLTFISGEVAHSGNMRIGTPVATMGIRGTVGGVTTANDGTVQFYVSQSATGAVIINEQGQIIANVVQDGPMIVVRPVGPLQVVAEEIQKSPAQLAIELQALQQIVSIKAVGDQLLQQFFQQQPNPNPQSPNDQPHTQFRINLNYGQNNGNNGDPTGDPNPHKFDDATVQLISHDPDTPLPPTIIDDLLHTNLPPITFAPLAARIDEDHTLTFSGHNAISVHDLDSTVLTVTLTVTHGLLSLSSVAGLTFASGHAAGATTLTFSGSQAAINAALDGMIFTPSGDYNGVAALTITTQDGDSPPITTSVPIEVAAVNDAPVLDYFNVNVAEGGTVTLTPADFHVTDPDGPATIFTVTNISGGHFVVTGQSALQAQHAAGIVTFTAADIAAGRVMFVHDGGENPPVFTITVSDGVTPGTPVTETGTITQHVNDAPVVTAATATVSEEGLCHGNPDSTGLGDTTDSATAHGTIKATDAEGDSLTYKLGLPTAALTSDGEPVTWTLGEDGTLEGSACGNPVISVTLDEHTGAYTVNLLGPIDHPNTNAEDTLNFNIPVSVSDGQATTNSTLTVSVEDDRPVAADEAVAIPVSSETSSVNIVIILDTSGSMAGQSLALAQAAIANLLATTGVSINGVMSASFASQGEVYQGEGGPWVGAEEANDYFQSLFATGGTNYAGAINSVMSAWGTPPSGADKTLVYFISDGEPTPGEGLDANLTAAWEAFLQQHGVDTSYAIGISTGVDDADLAPIAWKNGDPNFQPIVLANADGLDGTLQDTVTTTHNIFTDGGATAGFGADGGHIQSLTVDGVTYSWDGDHTLTSSAQGQWTHTAASFTVTTALGGVLTFYFGNEAGHAAGDWIYTPPASLANAANELFHYVLVDNDGDRSLADIKVDIGAPEFNSAGLVTVSDEIHTLVTGLAALDGDAGTDPLTFSIGAGNGALDFYNSGSGVTVGGSGSHVLTATGTLAAINAALAHGISFTPEFTQPATEVVTATIDDHHGGTDTLNFIFGVGYAPTAAVSLAGTSGKDIIFSAGTDATLTGNGGSDTFVFSVDNGGTAHITDFSVADDYLQISHSIFASADALLGSAQSDGKGNTVISSPNHGSVVLEQVNYATFQSIDHSHIVIV